MSHAEPAVAVSTTDEALLRRARRHSTTFARLWDDNGAEFESPNEALYAGSVLLAWEQRGYRNAEQITRVLSRLPLGDGDVTDELDTIVGRAINTVEAIYNREPTTNLDHLIRKLGTLSSDERRRILRKRGFDWPTTDEVHTRLRNAVFETIEAGGYTVLDAPTAAGKTDIAVTTPWLEYRSITGGEPVILLVETKQARDEAKERAEEAGLNVAVLQSYDVCPVADGDYDDDIWIEGIPASAWFEDQIEWRGIQAGKAHSRAEQLADGGLPCCPGDELCELREQWEHVPRHEDYNGPVYDLIIATDAFAHVPSIRQNTHLIHDEQPSYTINFDENYELHQRRIQKMVEAFLTEVEAPDTTWEWFTTCARSNPPRQVADAVEVAIQQLPDDNWYHDKPNAHTLAPLLTRALWQALTNEPDANGRSAATIEYEPSGSSGDVGVDETKRLSVVIDTVNEVRLIRHIPDFSICRSIVGLDAWPCHPLWERNVLWNIPLTRILDDDERKLWRLFERGLAVIVVGDATRPMTTGENFSEQHARIIVESLSNRFPDRFSTVGTPSSIEDRIKRIMENAGIDEPETMHHGEQKSNNRFKDELVGLLYGCIDPGDDPILDLLAECEYTARPEYRGYDISCDKCGVIRGAGCNRCRCKTCDGDGCSTCHETGRQRAFGRRFVGPDADKATDFLESVRACSNAQMVGRWGREPTEDAVVYVCTTALPDELIDFPVPGVEVQYGAKNRAIIEQLIERQQATEREIREAIRMDENEMTVSKPHVWETLNRQAEYGNVVKHDGEGAYGADIYEWTGANFVSRNGIADLGDEFC